MLPIFIFFGDFNARHKQVLLAKSNVVNVFSFHIKRSAAFEINQREGSLPTLWKNINSRKNTWKKEEGRRYEYFRKNLAIGWKIEAQAKGDKGLAFLHIKATHTHFSRVFLRVFTLKLTQIRPGHCKYQYAFWRKLWEEKFSVLLLTCTSTVTPDLKGGTVWATFKIWLVGALWFVMRHVRLCTGLGVFR